MRVLLCFLLVCLVVGFFPFTTCGRFGAGGAAAPAGVQVEQTAKVGSYRVAVLQSDSPGALDRWLTEHGYAGLSAADRSVVSDYVSRGWHFVAARLRRAGDGVSTPHPIAVEFPAEKAVYPVRLTGTTGSKLYLELFVAAPEMATCPELTREYSDTFSLEQVPGAGHQRRIGSQWNEWVEFSILGLRARNMDASVPHPHVRRELWDGCVLTRLAGTLDPETMLESDIRLTWQEPRPYRYNYYTARAVRQWPLFVGMALWGVLGPALLLAFHRRPGSDGGRLSAGIAVIPGVIAVSLLVGGAVYGYMAQKKVEVKRPGYTFRPSGRSVALELGRRVAEITENPDAGEVRRVCRELITGQRAPSPDLLDYLLPDGTLRSPLTGRTMQAGHEPGDYTVFEDGRGVVLRVYEQDGAPVDVIIGRASTNRSPQTE